MAGVGDDNDGLVRFALQLHAYTAAGGRVFDAVGQQVESHLVQAQFIAHHLNDLCFGHLQGDGDAFVLSENFALLIEIAHQVVEIDLCFLHRQLAGFAFCQQQEVLDDAPHAVDLLEVGFEGGAEFLRISRPAQCHLCLPAQNGEGGAQFVSGIGGELAGAAHGRVQPCQQSVVALHQRSQLAAIFTFRQALIGQVFRCGLVHLLCQYRQFFQALSVKKQAQRSHQNQGESTCNNESILQFCKNSLDGCLADRDADGAEKGASFQQRIVDAAQVGGVGAFPGEKANLGFWGGSPGTFHCSRKNSTFRRRCAEAGPAQVEDGNAGIFANQGQRRFNFGTQVGQQGGRLLPVGAAGQALGQRQQALIRFGAQACSRSLEP